MKHPVSLLKPINCNQTKSTGESQSKYSENQHEILEYEKTKKLNNTLQPTDQEIIEEYSADSLHKREEFDIRCFNQYDNHIDDDNFNDKLLDTKIKKINLYWKKINRMNVITFKKKFVDYCELSGEEMILEMVEYSGCIIHTNDPVDNLP